MGKTILKIVGVIVGVLLFPFLFTLLVSGGVYESSSQPASNTVQEVEPIKIESIGDKTMDEYIMAVLATYAPLNLQLDTLKAQAIIVRTNVYYKEQESRSKGKKLADLTEEDIGLPTTTMDSLAKKYGEEEAASYISTLENVVYSTKDQVLTYGEQPILACYHYASAGKTRDYKESTGIALPYLTSVDSSQDIEATEGITSLKITYEEAVDMLEKQCQVSGLDPEKLMEQISIAKQDTNGYVLEVKAGDKTLTGEEVQQCFYLNSTNFYFTQYEGNLRIVCQGKGTGYGFSQYGADTLAKQGQTFDQLLAYYYPKTTLTTLAFE